MLSLWPVLLGFLGLSLNPAKAPAAPAVQIDIHPEVFASHTYPKGQPPPHAITVLPSQEAGFCRTMMHPQAGVGLQWRRLGLRTVTATVTQVQFSVGMQIDIYVEDDTGTEVMAHESTHRAISQHYYASAEAVARDLANQMIGRKLELPVRHQDERASAISNDLAQELIDAFEWRVLQRCNYAQERFDDITNHGLDPITNDAAMKQAIAEEAAHWEKVKDQPPPKAHSE